MIAQQLTVASGATVVATTFSDQITLGNVLATLILGVSLIYAFRSRITQNWEQAYKAADAARAEQAAKVAAAEARIAVLASEVAELRSRPDMAAIADDLGAARARATVEHAGILDAINSNEARAAERHQTLLKLAEQRRKLFEPAD